MWFVFIFYDLVGLLCILIKNIGRYELYVIFFVEKKGWDNILVSKIIVFYLN